MNNDKSICFNCNQDVGYNIYRNDRYGIDSVECRHCGITHQVITGFFHSKTKLFGENNES